MLESLAGELAKGSRLGWREEGSALSAYRTTSQNGLPFWGMEEAQRDGKAQRALSSVRPDHESLHRWLNSTVNANRPSTTSVQVRTCLWRPEEAEDVSSKHHDFIPPHEVAETTVPRTLMCI